MKIFVVRHGETTSDIENRYGGDYDDHLTAKGIGQTKNLAVKLSHRGIQIIYSSPRIRTRETAEILKNTLNCPVRFIEGLKERNTYGILTGMVKTEAKKEYPELVNLVGDYHNTIDGAESYKDLLLRANAAFQYVISTPYDTIAILSHGGLIKCIFRDILKFGELNDLPDCAIIELERNNLGYKIISMNDASFRPVN